MKRAVNRWVVVAAGTWLQACLGSVYAWSYFQSILTRDYGWTQRTAAGVFSTAIFFLGLSAAAGGMWMPRTGPRRLALTGGLLFAVGHVVAALALARGWWWGVYAGYGLLGGVGLGLGYVTPVATVAKWFPDRKGLATGLVIMGFGFGAVLMSKVLAPVLMHWGGGRLEWVWCGLGLFFAVALAPAAWMMRNPDAPAAGAPAVVGTPYYPDHWLDRGFVLMWMVFFFNILAGIAIIPFQSPLMQDLLRDRGLTAGELAAAGATLIAVSSLFNGLGRIVWGWVSDHAGRIMTFRLLLATQLAAVAALTQTRDPRLFGALVCYVLLCYGGGFGTMPAFVLNRFGPAHMPAAYGTMLTAWAAAGVAGPLLTAWLADRWPARATALSFTLTAVLLGAGLVIALTVRDYSRAARRGS